MFVETDGGGRISAAYVEEQYPGQRWLPASDEGLQSFLGDQPRLGRDPQGRTCLLPAPPPQPLPERAPPEVAATTAKPVGRGRGRMSPEEASRSLAMRFTVALYEVAQHEPLPWRWIGEAAERAGIRHCGQLELALANGKAAKLLKVDDGVSVTLTLSGMRAAREILVSPLGARLRAAAPAHPNSSAEF